MKFLIGIPLFSVIGQECIETFIESGDIYLRTYASDTVIYNGQTSSSNIDPGIVMGGSAAVFSNDTERDICLRILSRGNLFGVINMFNTTDRFISTIKAEKKCSAVFIKQCAFRRLLEENREFMYSYLEFLAMRIEFLNRKIRQFTAGSAERKLAVYLDTVSEDDSFLLPFSYTKLSEMLDIGRASLYRALDSLTESSIIKRVGKNITIIDRVALRAYGSDNKN